MPYKKHILRGTQKEEMTSWMYIIKEAELDRKRSPAQMSVSVHIQTHQRYERIMYVEAYLAPRGGRNLLI